MWNNLPAQWRKERGNISCKYTLHYYRVFAGDPIALGRLHQIVSCEPASGCTLSYRGVTTEQPAKRFSYEDLMNLILRGVGDVSGIEKHLEQTALCNAASDGSPTCPPDCVPYQDHHAPIRASTDVVVTEYNIARFDLATGMYVGDVWSR